MKYILLFNEKAPRKWSKMLNIALADRAPAIRQIRKYRNFDADFVACFVCKKKIFKAILEDGITTAKETL